MTSAYSQQYPGLYQKLCQVQVRYQEEFFHWMGVWALAQIAQGSGEVTMPGNV